MCNEVFRIVNEDGHYMVYINGRFYASADTRSEAVSEIENYHEGRVD